MCGSYDLLLSSFIIHNTILCLHPSPFIIHNMISCFHHSSFTVRSSAFIIHRSQYDLLLSSFIIHNMIFCFHHSSFIGLSSLSSFTSFITLSFAFIIHNMIFCFHQSSFMIWSPAFITLVGHFETMSSKSIGAAPFKKKNLCPPKLLGQPLLRRRRHVLGKYRSSPFQEEAFTFSETAGAASVKKKNLCP